MIAKPIDELAALNIQYGAAGVKLSQALNKENLVAIRTLETRVEDDGSKVAESFLQLTSRLTDAEKAVAGIDIKGPIEAGLSELRRTIANANYASSEVVDIKIANYGDGVTAWQTNEERVRAEKDKAFAEDIDKMGVRITTEVGDVKTTLEGSFNDLRDIVIEDGEATAKRIDEMGTRITLEVDGVTKAYEGAIKTVEETLAKDGEATAKRVDTLSSSVDGLTGPNGIIQTIQDTEARNDGARAQETKTLQSRLDNFNGASLEQQFTTYANKVDGVGASYVLKVNSTKDGVLYVAGGGIAIDNGVSAIAWEADSFRISTPGSTPKQVFYADEQGVYMPDVRVNKLMANSITINEIAPGLSRSPRYTAPDVMIPSYEVTIIETPFFSVGFNNDATGTTENGSSLAIVSFTHDGSQVVDTAAIISVYVDIGAGYQVARTSKSGIATKDGNTVWTLKFTDSIAITASGTARVKITGQGVPFGNSPRNSGTYARQPEISILSIGR